MRGFRVAFRKEWIELWRTYRMLVACVVLAVFGLMSPVLAKYTPEIIKSIPEGETIAKMIPEPTILDAVGQYVKSIGQFGLILGLLLTMGVVAQEKDKGTAAMILVKPLSRASFLAAKFSVLALLFMLAIAVAGAACYYYTSLLFGNLDLLHWASLNGLLLLYVLVYVAITLFFSVAARSQAAAGGLAFGTMLVLEIIGALPRYGDFMPAKLLGWGIGIMGGSADVYWEALAVSTGIVVASFLGAWLLFRKQEL
jgi:ABC-2 type transport system permease protein